MFAYFGAAAGVRMICSFTTEEKREWKKKWSEINIANFFFQLILAINFDLLAYMRQ